MRGIDFSDYFYKPIPLSGDEVGAGMVDGNTVGRRFGGLSFRGTFGQRAMTKEEALAAYRPRLAVLTKESLAGKISPVEYTNRKYALRKFYFLGPLPLVGSEPPTPPPVPPEPKYVLPVGHNWRFNVVEQIWKAYPVITIPATAAAAKAAAVVISSPTIPTDVVTTSSSPPSKAPSGMQWSSVRRKDGTYLWRLRATVVAVAPQIVAVRAEPPAVVTPETVVTALSIPGTNVMAQMPQLPFYELDTLAKQLGKLGKNIIVPPFPNDWLVAAKAAGLTVPAVTANWKAYLPKTLTVYKPDRFRGDPDSMWYRRYGWCLSKSIPQMAEEYKQGFAILKKFHNLPDDWATKTFAGVIRSWFIRRHDKRWGQVVNEGINLASYIIGGVGWEGIVEMMNESESGFKRYNADVQATKEIATGVAIAAAAAVIPGIAAIAQQPPAAVAETVVQEAVVQATDAAMSDNLKLKAEGYDEDRRAGEMATLKKVLAVGAPIAAAAGTAMFLL